MTVSYDRYGGGCMRIAAVVVFIFEVVLSHTPGQASGAQSQSLSRLTHLPEGFLRRGAHVVFILGVGAVCCSWFWPLGFCFLYCMGCGGRSDETSHPRSALQRYGHWSKLDRDCAWNAGMDIVLVRDALCCFVMVIGISRGDISPASECLSSI